MDELQLLREENKLLKESVEYLKETREMYYIAFNELRLDLKEIQEELNKLRKIYGKEVNNE